MTLSLRRKYPKTLYLGTSPVLTQLNWPTRILSSRRRKQSWRTKRQYSRLLGKSIQKRMLLKALLPINAEKSGILSIPMMHQLWTQRLWFLNTALPLAAQLKPMKPAHLFGWHLRAAVPLKLWLGQEGIKFLQKVTQMSHAHSFKMNQPKTWNLVADLETYAPVIWTRLGFATFPNMAKFWIQHRGVVKNGFISQQSWAPILPGDVIQQQDFLKSPWLKLNTPTAIFLPKRFFQSTLKLS